MNKTTPTIFLLSLAAIQLVPAQAADTESLLSIDRIFHDKEFEINEKVASKWLHGGESYTTVEASDSVEGGFDIVRHDPASGEQSILVGAERLIPKGADKPLEIKDYSWSEDGRLVLIKTNTVKFRRYEPLADYWLLDLSSSALRQIAARRKAIVADVREVLARQFEHCVHV